MALTSDDLVNWQLKTGMRGYLVPQVDELLDEVADELDRLHGRIRELEGEREAVRNSLDDQLEVEETLRRTLYQAQKAADQTIEDARATAVRIVEDARNEGEALLAQAQQKARSTYEDAVREATDERAQVRASLEAEEARMRAVRSELRSEIDRLRGIEAETRRLLRGLYEDRLNGLDRPLVDLPSVAAGLAEPLPARGGSGRVVGDEGPAAEAPTDQAPVDDDPVDDDRVDDDRVDDDRVDGDRVDGDRAEHVDGDPVDDGGPIEADGGPVEDADGDPVVHVTPPDQGPSADEPSPSGAPSSGADGLRDTWQPEPWEPPATTAAWRHEDVAEPASEPSAAPTPAAAEEPWHTRPALDAEPSRPDGHDPVDDGGEPRPPWLGAVDDALETIRANDEVDGLADDLVAPREHALGESRVEGSDDAADLFEQAPRRRRRRQE